MVLKLMFYLFISKLSCFNVLSFFLLCYYLSGILKRILKTGIYFVLIEIINLICYLDI